METEEEEVETEEEEVETEEEETEVERNTEISFSRDDKEAQRHVTCIQSEHSLFSFLLDL